MKKVIQSNKHLQTKLFLIKQIYIYFFIIRYFAYLKEKTEFIYDITGNLLTKKDPLSNITTYTYNAANRPTTVKDALNRLATLDTDFKGRITAITDALNNRKEYQYDESGNLTKITEGQNITAMSYDSSNRLASIIDPEGNITTYAYAGATCSSCTGGSADSPIKITDPLGNITKYIYDKNGRPNSIIDPMGNISLLARDATGRVVTRCPVRPSVRQRLPLLRRYS